MASNTTNIHRLQTAINMRGYNILYNTNQFYSEEQNRPVTIYCIKRAVWDEEKGRTRNIELFKSTSQLQILLFLKDFWDEINGIEPDHSNPLWEEAKQKYYSQKED